MGDMTHDIHEKYRDRPSATGPDGNRKPEVTGNENRGHGPSEHSGGKLNAPNFTTGEAAPFRRHSLSKSRATGNTADETASSHYSSIAPFDDEESNDGESEDESAQDIDEIWFAGGHGDVGGGWDVEEGTRSTSHVPLVWMVREAMKAGLAFDVEKVVALGCSEALGDASPDEGAQGGGNGIQRASMPVVPDVCVEALSPCGSPYGEEHKAESHDTSPTGTEDAEDAEGAQLSAFHAMMHKAHCARTHDSLNYDCGMSFGSVLSWKIMEYMPFRRMDLHEDGTWTPIRWPLPCGEVRDIPHNVRVHGSVIRRMKNNPSYRPGNLIIGGGGRGCRVAPESYGIGEWECVAHPGDPVSEVWRKRV